MKKSISHDIVMINVNDEFSFSPSRQPDKPEPYVVPIPTADLSTSPNTFLKVPTTFYPA